MIYALCHVDDAEVEKYDWRSTDPEMDVSVLVPGADKLCTIVPLGGLHDFLPILAEAHAGTDAGPLRCEHCGEAMDVPIVVRPEGPLDLGDTPYRLGEAVAEELAGE